jgi:hypothetical protein
LVFSKNKAGTVLIITSVLFVCVYLMDAKETTSKPTQFDQTFFILNKKLFIKNSENFRKIWSFFRKQRFIYQT